MVKDNSTSRAWVEVKLLALEAGSMIYAAREVRYHQMTPVRSFLNNAQS